MHYAIIGAGLAGLSAAYFLREKGARVTLFDSKGVGGGASGCASGLCHPYPGRSGRLSPYGIEALAKTRELVAISEKALGRKVALQNGIIRLAWENPPLDEDLEKWDEKIDSSEGRVVLGEGFRGSSILIRSGMTLFMADYLEGLFRALGDVELIRERIDHLEELSSFNHIIVAAGGGTKSFFKGRDLQYIKGQILTCESKIHWERSIGMFGQGYLTPLIGPGKENLVHLGATYEHHYSSVEPDLSAALHYLKPRMERFLPPLDTFTILNCQAGERVAVKGSSLPLITKLDKRTTLFTGLGSRGLLYHAYYASILAASF